MKINEKKLIDLFLELIQVDSVSLHERAMVDFLIEKFRGWNIEAREDAAAEKIGGNAGNVIVRLESGSNNASPLVLLAHMDTVQPTAAVKPIIEDGVIRSDGTTILGADNRSGVALILYVISEILEKKLKHRSLEIVFTVAEELGMFGALELDYSQLKAKEGYIFDCSARPGSYVAESPTAYDFQVQCRGRAAHSAVSPEKGINAISMAMEIMNRFPVGRINKNTVTNIGTIHGGTIDNVVPDMVKLTGEFRSFIPSEIERIKAELENASRLVSQKFGGTCDVDFKQSFEGYKFAPDTPVISHLHEAMLQLNFVPDPMVYSGGSDVNVLNAHGVKAVNIGIGASNAHSKEEYIAIADMLEGAELLLRLVEAEEA